MTKRDLFFLSISDCVSDLLYYDRKEDEELSVKDVEELFKSGEITVEEVVEVFRKSLEECFKGHSQ